MGASPTTGLAAPTPETYIPVTMPSAKKWTIDVHGPDDAVLDTYTSTATDDQTAYYHARFTYCKRYQNIHGCTWDEACEYVEKHVWFSVTSPQQEGAK